MSNFHFLPSIENLRKSSLPAAKRIYSAMDYLEGVRSSGSMAGKRRFTKESREKAKKLRLCATEQKPLNKLERTKEYSQELNSRKEKAKLARERYLAHDNSHRKLRELGQREKRRFNELLSVYALQQGPSFRDSARVVKPKFPVLLNSSKSRVICREKTQNSHHPNLSPSNKLDRDQHD